MTDSTDSPDGTASRRSVLKVAGGAVAASAMVAAGSSSGSAAPGSYTEEWWDGEMYKKYVPSTYDGSQAVPCLMMLHGCTQTPDEIKNVTRFNEVAEDHGFIVLYPEQTTGIYDCWQWFNDANSTRGNGEARDFVGILNQEKDRENIDDKRCYLAGFSAGGAMVPNVLAEYADVWAAGAIHSGTMYDVAESQTEGNNVISDSDCSTGTSSDPQVEGEHAYDRMVDFGIARPLPTIVFHGTDDTTVYPCNGEEAAEQATETADLAWDGSDDGDVDYTVDDRKTGSGSSLSYTEYEYHDPDGHDVVDHYVVDGMTHAWSGGADGYSYSAPGGPDASRILWEYFTNWTLDGHASGNSAPTADVQASDTTVSTGETVDFDGSGSSDPDGSIASYGWDFDDGSTATGETTSHSWDSTGTYSVVLTVTDDDGATDTASVDVDVGSGTTTHVVDGFEDDDGLSDYDRDAHESSPYLNNYFVDTTDSGGYDATPPEGSYDLGSYSDDAENHSFVHTYSFDDGGEEPNTLPRPDDYVTYYTQTDYLDGYGAYADASQVRTWFFYGVQDAATKYGVEVSMPGAAAHADEVRLLRFDGNGAYPSDATELAAASGVGLDYAGNWYEVRVDWTSGGDHAVEVVDVDGGDGTVASLSATDDSYGAGGIGFMKTGGPSDGLYSLGYWDHVTVER
jgi:poly(hydroxyalkanoate) depolymerase family esterase